jgi:pimeloyl-ACP methyl ester carboxylesterase
MAQPAATDRAVVVDGLKLFTRRRPGRMRPPLVLLHGIGGTLEAWGPLVSELVDRDVVMIDPPGSGGSDVPDFPLRVPAVADRYCRTLRSLGVEHADVLGFSLGGLAAQELARRHPELIRRLILVNTIMGVGSKLGSWKVRRTLLSTKRYTDRACAERDMPVLAGGRTARDPAVLAAILDARESHAPSWRGYYFQQWGMMGWSSRQWLSELRVRTLVLQGGDDPVVPAANGEMLAQRIPDAVLELIPEAGHMLLFDEPATAAPVIERFLAR